MKNILFFFISDLEDKTFTGGPRGVLNLIEAVKDERYKPILVSQVNSLLVKKVSAQGIENQVIPFEDILKVQNEGFRTFSFLQFCQALNAVFQYSFQLSKFIKERDVDLIWSRNIKSVLLSIIPSLLNRKPLLWDIGLEKKSKGIFWWINLLALIFSHQILTESQAQAKILFGERISSFFSHKITTIYRGISIERVESINLYSSDRYYQKPHDSYIKILNISSINPRKNQLLLLKSVASLIKKFPNIRLKLVGAPSDDDYYLKLQRFVINNNLTEYIEFMGWREDIPQILGQSDIFVLSSHAEGLSYSIAEAMFAKLPVIATDVGGASDLISHAETGLLVKDDSVEEMTSSLETLVSNSDQLKQIGLSGYETASNKYSVYEFEDNINNFIDSILGR